ncbi:MAG: hypothetical protein AAFX03_06985 [Pseudomonadota bacterium]
MEFGPNGTVAQPGGGATYETNAAQPIQRVRLAIFLCGLVACLAVAAAGFLGLLSLGLYEGLFGAGAVRSGETPFLSGVMIAFGMGALNWFMGYITIPAAWFAIGFSIGRFPRRRITRPAPYYRWGAIWGAALVCLVTGPLSFALSSTNSAERSLTAMGGLAGGFVVGAAAGLVCAALFRLIVRPAEQIREIATDVF